MYFAILMEIIISIERISQFTLRFRNIIAKFKPIIIAIVIIIICVIINLQYFFTEQPSYANLKLNSTASFGIYFPEITSFSLSLTGIILNFGSYIFRDVILLIIQCILAIISIYFIKKYFKNKKNILTHPTVTQNSEIAHSHTSNNITIKVINAQQNIPTLNKNINKNDHKLTLMVIIMSLMSVVEHILFLAFVIFLTYFVNDTAFLIASLAELYMSFKHFFNNLFKKEFKKIFCI
jgi:hypothetical protein